jgi:Tol biopolymer transport system component
LKRLAVLLLACWAVGSAVAADTTRRAFTVEDLDRLRTVADPSISPDGQWIAYSVRTTDVPKDKRFWHIWMTSWDGRQSMQVTQSPESEHSPGFSPDGRYLAFLSARAEKDGPDALWLLDRAGGDARQVTHFKGDVTDYDWSPDGTRLVLVVQDDPLPGSDAADEDKTPPPLVIDRYYFKDDETGYLDSRRMHLYVLDVASGEIRALTDGRFSERFPAWSPDGTQLAFLSQRAADPDRDNMCGL